jgi:hypothetical protein
MEEGFADFNGGVGGITGGLALAMLVEAYEQVGF